MSGEHQQAQERTGESGPASQADEALAYSVPEAAKRLSIGATLCWELVRAGKIRSIRVSTRVLVPRVALEEFILHQLDGGSV